MACTDDLCATADTMVLYTEVLMREKCYKGGSIGAKTCSRELIAYMCFIFKHLLLNKLLRARSDGDLRHRRPVPTFQKVSAIQSRLKQRQMNLESMRSERFGLNVWTLRPMSRPSFSADR